VDRLTTEFETYMRDWILNDLSSPIAMLNGFSKCPYAKTAFLDNKVKFFDDTDLDKVIKEWNDELIEVAVINLGDISSYEISLKTELLNRIYMPSDFIFLDDHVENEERMNDIVFNNGKYNVLFLQRKSKLDLATKKLEKLGYYQNWTKEYYDEVVGWRS
jgi:hypothetical protein